jgi:hypothetical protein
MCQKHKQRNRQKKVSKFDIPQKERNMKSSKTTSLFTLFCFNAPPCVIIQSSKIIDSAPDPWFNLTGTFLKSAVWLRPSKVSHDHFSSEHSCIDVQIRMSSGVNAENQSLLEVAGIAETEWGLRKCP